MVWSYHSLRPIAYQRLSALPPLRAALGALKFAFDADVRMKVMVAIVRDLPDHDPFELQVLRYVAKVYNAGRETLAQAIALAKPGREDDLVPTIAQQWLKQGRAEGMAEGRTEGKADTLLRLLRRRFKTLPAGIEPRIRAAGTDQLDEWTDLVLDARELADIFDAPLH